MSKTNSIAFPNMFDITRNKVAVLEDNASIVNRDRLLLLTEPTELYNSPEFGVGLRKYLFQYNTENTKAMAQDRIKEQLRVYEPCCDADKTTFTDGLLYTGDDRGKSNGSSFQELNFTVGVQTVYNDELTITVDNTD